MSTSIFEAMGGYEGTQDDAGEQATPKRRRVDEYTLRLTAQQWRVLELLADGARFVREGKSLLALLRASGIVEYYARSTAASLTKRGLITEMEYTISDAGRHALRIREENKPGQI